MLLLPILMFSQNYVNKEKPLEEQICQLCKEIISMSDYKIGEFKGTKSQFEEYKKKLFVLMERLSFNVSSKHIKAKVYGKSITSNYSDQLFQIIAKNCPDFKKIMEF
jgi:hypothetical protein